MQLRIGRAGSQSETGEFFLSRDSFCMGSSDAGVSVGVFSSLADAAARACRVQRTHTPSAQRHTRLDDTYRLWTRLAAAMEPCWPALDRSAIAQ